MECIQMFSLFYMRLFIGKIFVPDLLLVSINIKLDTKEIFWHKTLPYPCVLRVLLDFLDVSSLLQVPLRY